MDCNFESIKPNERKKKWYRKRHSVAFVGFEVENSRSSLTVSCTLLFAMSQLFCGIVIPLSDSFVTNSVTYSGHAYYLETYLIMQYLSGAICIFYLQGYIFLRERSMAKKRNTEESYIEDQQKLNIEENNGKKEKEYDSSDSPKVKFEDPSKEETDLNNTTNPERNQFSVTSYQTNITINSAFGIISNPQSDVDSITSGNLNKMSIVRDSEGINLYLRLGAVGFGFGVMVHDGFKIADKFRLQGSQCHNDLWTPKFGLHLLYIFIQTFFVFKYHRIIFLKHKSIIRFILYNLVVSNTCQWFKTVVYEINHELLEHHYQQISNSSESFNTSNCSQQLSNMVSPYLFPCAIEYSLISAAIFYKMLQKVGRKKRESIKVENQFIDEIKNIKYSECHRSHRGLFIGLLFFMVTLVGVAVFFLFKKSSDTLNLSIIVYQLSEITLLMSGIVTLIWAFIKMRHLKFRHLTEEQAFDDNLLLIGLAGVFSYNLFLFISTIDSLTKLTSKQYSMIVILFIFKSLIEMLQSTIQALFVLESSRKSAQEEHHLKTKPGRSLVTFLIIINLALWIVSIFEAKKSDEHLLFTKYYQKVPWSIITHTLLPLIIFFRFHSSICLMNIWSKTYRGK